MLAIIVEAIGERRPDVRREVNPNGWGLNVPSWPDTIFDTPDFGTLGDFNLFGSFESAGAVAAILLVFTLMLADFFDTMGTMTAIGAEAGLLDADGVPPNTERILVVDSLAAAAGGAGGCLVEHLLHRVGLGRRRGCAHRARVGGDRRAVPARLCRCSSLVAVIPSEAAVPALVLVGFLMMQQVKGISWDDLEIAIPAFLTIVLMPFTYSITVGIGAGFLAYVLIKIVRGKVSAVHPLLWVDQRRCSSLYFAIDPLTSLLT